MNQFWNQYKYFSAIFHFRRTKSRATRKTKQNTVVWIADWCACWILLFIEPLHGVISNRRLLVLSSPRFSLIVCFCVRFCFISFFLKQCFFSCFSVNITIKMNRENFITFYWKNCDVIKWNGKWIDLALIVFNVFVFFFIRCAHQVNMFARNCVGVKSHTVAISVPIFNSI